MFRGKWRCGVALAALVAVGCAHCDTCDDFPTPCADCDSGGSYTPAFPGGTAPLMMPGDPMLSPIQSGTPPTSAVSGPFSGSTGTNSGQRPTTPNPSGGNTSGGNTGPQTPPQGGF